MILIMPENVEIKFYREHPIKGISFIPLPTFREYTK